MAWFYSQSSGAVSLDGSSIAMGYSGHDEGLNNPALQNDPGIGPIPLGTYTIGRAFDDPDGKGPVVMRLTPDPSNQMFGRDGFMIHGDTATRDHQASHGCIILDRPYREQIAASGDQILVVTA